jgi:hypothetical protein
MLVIPATWDVEVGRLWLEGSPSKKLETLSEKYLKQKWMGEGVT